MAFFWICCTGTMTEKLADYGYDMIGVEQSEDMLELAMEKRMESGKDILYLLQDMREFELYEYRAIVMFVIQSTILQNRRNWKKYSVW